MGEALQLHTVLESQDRSNFLKRLESIDEDEYWKLVDRFGSEEELIKSRHNIPIEEVRAYIEKGLEFSEIHMGPKFNVDDFVDIDQNKIAKLAGSVLLQGEFDQNSGESINDKAFRATLELASKHKGAVDLMIDQLGQHHTINPRVFISEMAKSCANPHIDDFQKARLVDSFEYIYSCGGSRYDEALSDNLVFDDPERYTQTGYFLNLLSRAHALSKYGPEFSKNVSEKIEDCLNDAVVKQKGSYFLIKRAEEILRNIRNEDYEKENDFKSFLIAPGITAIFNENGLHIVKDGQEKAITTSDITLSPNNITSNIDLADFEFLERKYMRDIIEQEFGFSLSDFSLAEQYQFLLFLKEKSQSDVDRVKKFTNKFGRDGMKTFLSLEYGRDFGDKIIEMGEKLEEQDANSLFTKYSEIVDSANNAASELGLAYTGEAKSRGELVDKVRDNLLRYGRKLLENFGGRLNVSDDKKNIEQLMTQLAQTKADIVLSAVVFKALANEGVVIEEISNMDIETLKREDLDVKDKDEMQRIFHENRGEYPEDLRAITEKEFGSVLNEGEREFHILRRGNDIVAFARFDELPNGNLYIGSLNVRPEIKSLTVGGTFLADLIKQKNKDHTLEAEAYSKNKMLKNYTDKFGFEIVGEIPNYKGSEHLFYKMEIPKGKMT